MRKKIFQWLGKEFITLSCEGRVGVTATEEGQEVLRRFDQELRGAGLSLGNTVRTTLFQDVLASVREPEMAERVSTTWSAKAEEPAVTPERKTTES